MAARASYVAPAGIGPALADHAVQFYEETSALVATVGRFVRAGLENGDRVLLIASADHRDAFLAELEPATLPHVIASGDLTLLDAEDALAELMIGDLPDGALFGEFLQRVTGAIREGRPGARMRAFGEMTSVLWRGGNRAAAIALEELWDATVKELSISLLCGYPMAHFGRPGDAPTFLEVCRNHSLVLPTEQMPEIADPRAYLREIARLQQRTRALEHELRERRERERESTR